MNSPAGGLLPTVNGNQFTPVGGVIVDIIGTNGARIVAELSASQCAAGSASGGNFVFGTLSGFDSSIVTALGGGISKMAVRITLVDGDNANPNTDPYNLSVSTQTTTSIIGGTTTVTGKGSFKTTKIVGGTTTTITTTTSTPGSGDFEWNSDILLLNGVAFGDSGGTIPDTVNSGDTTGNIVMGNWSDVITERTDGLGNDVLVNVSNSPDSVTGTKGGFNPYGGFGDDNDPYNGVTTGGGWGGGTGTSDTEPDSGWFYVNSAVPGDSAVLTAIYQSLGTGSMTFTFHVTKSGSTTNALDFSQGVDSSLVSTSVGVTVATKGPTITAPGIQTVNTGQSTNVNLGSFLDPGNVAGSTGSTDHWNMVVNWGDGTSGSYTLTATGTITPESHTYYNPGSEAGSITITNPADTFSGSTNFSVNVVSPFAFKSQPTSTTAGGTLGTVQVQAPSPNQIVTLTEIDGTWTATTNASGLAVFSNLTVNTAGTFTLTASVAGSTTTVPSNSFSNTMLEAGHRIVQVAAAGYGR